MKLCWLREDKLPSNLLVNFSSKITKKINAIGAYNRQNGAALTQWVEYLEGMKGYLSKSVIAWDNMNRHPRLRNGGRFIGDFGYNVGYTIINDNATGQPLVYIFMASLKPREFGLRVPPNMNESRNINQIITEVIEQYLKQKLIV